MSEVPTTPIPERAPDEMADWCRAFREPEAPRQHPASEVLAEHHLMRAYLAVMEIEATRLVRGGPFRTALWDGVLAFTGRFVVHNHRGKEEILLFPAMHECGILGDRPRDILRHDHHVAGRITDALNDGYESGDWEKVVRGVSQYSHFMVPHMQEEEELLCRARDEFPADRVATLTNEFEQLESRVLEEWGRWRYLDAAKTLCEAVEIEYPFGEE